MKAKIISLAVAAAVGLSACNSGGGAHTDDGFDSTSVSNSTSLSANSLKAAPAAGPTNNGFINWIWQNSSMNFGMMFAGFPGTWAATLLQNLIFGVQEDVSIKYMKEISEKLDTILTNLELSMNIQQLP